MHPPPEKASYTADEIKAALVAIFCREITGSRGGGIRMRKKRGKDEGSPRLIVVIHAAQPRGTVKSPADVCRSLPKTFDINKLHAQ
jgi:hypothetical protein